MDQSDAPSWRLQLAYWFDTLSDGQRVAALVSAMVFLGASCLYLVGIASILLVYRLGPPPTPPAAGVALQSAAAPSPRPTLISSTPSPQASASTATAEVVSVASVTPSAAPTDTAAPVAAGEEPTPIAAPDVPRIRSVARMPEPAPVAGEVVEEDPEAVETRKPRVVATDAPLEETIIPLETPFGGTPDALAGTPVPGGEAVPTINESEATKEARKRRDNEAGDNESPEPDQNPDDPPGPSAAGDSTATPVPDATPAADAEPTPKKVKRTPSRDDEEQDNDD